MSAPVVTWGQAVPMTPVTMTEALQSLNKAFIELGHAATVAMRTMATINRENVMPDTLPLPTPDLPLLRKALDWAEAEALKPVDQSRWQQGTWRDVLPNQCGTTYCIAGYVCEVMGGTWVADSEFLLAEPDDHATWSDLAPDGQWRTCTSASSRATRLLGLTLDETSLLFDGDNDIETVRAVAETIAERAGERL